ncbi:putative necrosis-inducing factor-domain-containing protein [Cladorrhinum sp. PSN332]|nr:putative necrosis-inducing factor-domain-containing protein [Cladorrhinum sp. PSN332]
MKLTNTIGVALAGFFTVSLAAPTPTSIDNPSGHSSPSPWFAAHGMVRKPGLSESTLDDDGGDTDDDGDTGEDDDDDDEPEPPQPSGLPDTGRRLKKGVWVIPGNYHWDETTEKWVPDEDAPRRLSKRINDCASEVTNGGDEISDASPLTSDCKNLANSMIGHPKTWLLWGSTQKTLKKKGSCAFGATNLWKGTYAKVGNDDVQQNVESALADHTGQNGNGDTVVAASGTMDCQRDSSYKWAQMTWGVYHSSKWSSGGTFLSNQSLDTTKTSADGDEQSSHASVGALETKPTGCLNQDPNAPESSPCNGVEHATACPHEPEPVRPTEVPDNGQYKCNGLWYVPGRLNKTSGVTGPTLASQSRDCDEWTIDSGDENSDASPLKTDCEIMYNNIAGDGSWYLALPNVQRTLISYRSCAFGATDSSGGTDAWVANEDVRKVLDWVFDANVGKNSYGEEIVSGSGSMVCQPFAGHVTWGLYRTSALKFRDFPKPNLPGLLRTSRSTPEKEAFTNDCENELVDPADELSEGSPLVQDCYDLADSIAGKHTWKVNGHQQRTLKTSGTCAFGVENVGSDFGTAAKIGNDDIRKIIWAAIDAHGRDVNGEKRVAAKGTMQCQKEASIITKWLAVNWSVYHSKNGKYVEDHWPEPDVNGTSSVDSEPNAKGSEEGCGRGQDELPAVGDSRRIVQDAR